MAVKAVHEKGQLFDLSCAIKLSKFFENPLSTFFIIVHIPEKNKNKGDFRVDHVVFKVLKLVSNIEIVVKF